MSRASRVSYFIIPGKSACPGRGAVSFLPSWLSSTGSALIVSWNRGHSELRTMTATGEPRVLPWRTPARISSSSCSTRILAPRPKPRRRRASSAAMPSLDTTRPAGRPSTVATSPGPWDSPAVRKRNMAPRWYRQWLAAQVRRVVEKMMAAHAPSISGGPYGRAALRPFPMTRRTRAGIAPRKAVMINDQARIR